MRIYCLYLSFHTSFCFRNFYFKLAHYNIRPLFVSLRNLEDIFLQSIHYNFPHLRQGNFIPNQAELMLQQPYFCINHVLRFLLSPRHRHRTNHDTIVLITYQKRLFFVEWDQAHGFVVRVINHQTNRPVENVFNSTIITIRIF